MSSPHGSNSSLADEAQLSEEQREMMKGLMEATRDVEGGEVVSENGKVCSPDSPATTVTVTDRCRSVALSTFEHVDSRSNSRINPLGGVLAPGWSRSITVVLFFIGGPSFLFAYYFAQHDWRVWSPLAVIGPVILLSLFTTVFTDPGIIPRNTGPRPKPNVGAVFWESNYLFELDKKVTIGNGEMVRRWCSTCKLLRPPRASHCSICNNCVDVFDHHCGVIGACIGMRNFRYFCLFLWSSTLLVLYVGGWSVYYTLYPSTFASHFGWGTRDQLPPKADLVATVLIIYCAFALISVGWMGVLYARFACLGQTQRETEKHDYLFGRFSNPFRKSCPQNCYAMLCAKNPKTLLQNRNLEGNEGLILVDPWANEFPIEEV